MIEDQLLYVMNVEKSIGWKEHATASTLSTLEGSSAKEICRVNLESSKEPLDNFLAQSPYYASLSRYYGGPDGIQTNWSRCLGTMGWTAAPMADHFAIVLNRPRYMSNVVSIGPRDYPSVSSGARNDARELRYLAWGLSDPISWNAYEIWHKNRDAFISQLEEYYIEFYTQDSLEAKRMSADAFRYISDEILYAFGQDAALTRFINSVGINADREITTFNPKQLAKMTLDRIQEELPKELETPRSTLAYEALQAAMYTNQPINVLHEIVALLPPESANPYEKTRQQEQVDRILLAALHNDKYVELALSLGAGINSKTNSYGKTPLMYAAQLNEVESMRLLIENGADLNATTDDQSSCPSLERDNRTALMYAAENASTLIALLLEAGANIDAKDSVGNDIKWYLSRNTELSDRERLGVAKLLN